MHHEHDFEVLYEAHAYDIQWRKYLNQRQVLADLGKRYQLPVTKNFEQLAESYDNKYVTKRCLSYHSADECMLYFARQAHAEGFISAVARGGTKWVASIREICEQKHYAMIPIFFSIVPTSLNTACKIQANRVSVLTKNNSLFDCLQAHQLLDLQCCFITACEEGNVDVVMRCLHHDPIIHESGFLKAIENDHTDLVRLLLGMGARINRKVYTTAHRYHRKEVLDMLKRH